MAQQYSQMSSGQGIELYVYLGTTTLLTINHSQEYVTNEGHHTNTVEVVWHHLKTKILRRMSGVPRAMLDSYLHEEWIRSKYKDQWEFFEFILNSIANLYSIDTNVNRTNN